MPQNRGANGYVKSKTVSRYSIIVIPYRSFNRKSGNIQKEIRKEQNTVLLCLVFEKANLRLSVRRRCFCSAVWKTSPPAPYNNGGQSAVSAGTVGQNQREFFAISIKFFTICTRSGTTVKRNSMAARNRTLARKTPRKEAPLLSYCSSARSQFSSGR